MRAPLLLAGLIAAAVTTAAAPAQAHGHAAGGGTVVQTYPGHWGGPFGAWYGGWQPQVVVAVPGQPAQAQAQPWGGYEGQNLDRESWLRECRRRLGDNGVGGAVIGGVVGGVAGNVIAGRGNRVLGTVAGAAVGAVAGAAIDKAEDRTRVQDRCEAMLAAPAPAYAPGAGYAAYGYGAPMMLVPVMMVPAGPAPVAPGPRPGQPACRETVVTKVTYETVPGPRARRIIPGKRVRVAQDKRVPQ